MITIIIPVYNASSYIDQCLQSVFGQTYTDWECILIDDGSKDTSPEKCDAWCKKDSRFKVIHQKNQGVSAARNNGLKIAKGEWVTFIDSDDWIESDYLSQMLSGTNTVDLVVSGQIREFPDGSKIVYMPREKDTFVLESTAGKSFNDLNEKFLLYAPHEKLFHTEIIQINNLIFDENCSYGEDLQFVYEYLNHTTSIGTINHALYHYRMGDGNTLSTKLREDQFEVDYRQWKIVYNFYKNHDFLIESANKYLAKRLWGIVYDGLFLYPKIKSRKNNYIKTILSIPEIGYLKQYSNIFSAAKWIKYSITHRLSFVFELFFFVIK